MPGANRVKVTLDPVNTVLRKLAVPMIAGILGMVVFNLADTYFVGRLGTLPIAALSFTFPVVMVIGSINIGLGIGAGAVISKAVGANEKEKVTRLATDALILGLLVAFVIAVAGLLTIDPLFRALGADDATLPYVRSYMRIWYFGAPFVVIPMIGNNVIRALGDTKTPSFVMLFAAGLNLVLDPLLIMGVWIFPKLGVSGAALATVFSRATTFLVALYIQIVREKVVALKSVRLSKLFQSWKTILYIGLPNSIARMIIPLGTGIITGLIATYGHEAVAGYGIATRIEFFALSAINALVAVMPVYVGQNFGAKHFGRIRAGFTASEKFSVLNGAVLLAILAILAKPIAYLFTSDAAVVQTVVLYLRIVPVCYAFMGVVLLVNASYNALHKPIKAALVNLIQMLAIYIPLAVLSSRYFGLSAVFFSRIVSYVVVAIAAHFILRKDLGRIAGE